jgi:uncharacterized protein (TIGR03437 family)
MKSLRPLILLAGLAVYASGQTPAQTPVFSTGQAARLIIGQTNFTTGNFGTTNSLLGSPGGLAYANGVLWVADANRLGGTPDNNRVLEFSDVATYPGPTQDPSIPGSTCGACRGSASLVLGQPDFFSNNPAVTATGLRNPTGIATDGNMVIVADTDNNRVLIWNSRPTVNGQPPDVVIGQPNFTANGTSVPPTANSLRGPVGVWLADGKLFIADTQDNRVLIYNRVPTTNNAAADVVIGQPNFTSFVQPDLTQQNATPTASNMQTPVSVTTDGTRMFVADLAQNRVLIWNTIPSTNGAPADIALGQINLTTAISNNASTVTNPTPDSANNPEGVAPVMCQSDAGYAASLGQTGTKAVDSAGYTIFPAMCASTMSLPRFALSDGTRLFVADGGNDRILIWNTMPTQSGQPADVILGEPDQYSDNTGQNPDGADALQTPTSLAFDGVNLYVSDTYNRRVVVYTPAIQSIPLGAARNAASLNIYAIGSVSISGGVNAKDTVTITINGTGYTYTVQASDTLASIATGLVDLINKVPDPNVIASADLTTDSVVLTARVPDAPGGNITLATSTSANAQVTATASGSTLNIYLQNPTSIAPGGLTEIYSVPGATLCDNTAEASFTGTYLPFTLGGCEVFVDGIRAPLLYVSPTQLNIQMPLYVTDRTSVSVYARNTHADGTVTASNPIAVTIVPENPGIFAEYGNDPRPGIVYHGSSNAISVIQFNGGINAGDVAAITIGSNTYKYTVQASDTLNSVANAVAALIDGTTTGTPDPNVVAGAANQFESITLVALAPGAAGEGIAISQAVTGTSPQLSITVQNATTCCDNTQGSLVTADNPAIPGEVVYLFATGLGPTNPADIDTGQIFRGGSMNPPATPVDSILIGGTTANILSAALVPGLAGVYYVQFQIGVGTATDLQSHATIAQQSHVSNVVTFAIVAPPTTSTPSVVRRRRR